MKFIYDINLTFVDELVSLTKSDKEEYFKRIPIFKVNNVRKILEYDIFINTDYKNIIVSDTINAIALELINKKVVFYSRLDYPLEFKVNELAFNLKEELEIKYLKKKDKIIKTNISIKKEYLINNLNNHDFVKYLYYEITGSVDKSIIKMKNYLINDINNNFNEHYYEICDIINIR